MFVWPNLIIPYESTGQILICSAEPYLFTITEGPDVDGLIAARPPSRDFHFR
jgi:hypothetical protein